MPDAVVVGAGPNGLAAALRLAAAGLRVQVVEAAPRPGGGTRTEELLRPGYFHDVCSIVQPMAAAGAVFPGVDPQRRGGRVGFPRVNFAPPPGGGGGPGSLPALRGAAAGPGGGAAPYPPPFGPP